MYVPKSQKIILANLFTFLSTIKLQNGKAIVKYKKKQNTKKKIG